MKNEYSIIGCDLSIFYTNCANQCRNRMELVEPYCN